MTDDPQKPGLFTPGTTFDAAPTGDAERQAIDGLRGYAYQLAASALAWLDLSDTGRLYVEVAEDYATVAGDAIGAVQVKDTAASGSVTLKTASVREAIDSFVDLIERNPGREIQLRYFTTAPIGTEQAIADRPAGEAGLTYWRTAARQADVTPLRAILDREEFSERVREFVRGRDDESLRTELLRRIHWDCGQPDIAGIRRELEERLTVIGRDRFHLTAQEAPQMTDILMYQVLKKSILRRPEERVLTRAELYSHIEAATKISISRVELAETRQLAALAGGLGGGASGVSLAAGRFAWLIDGADLPAPRGIIARPKVESAVLGAVGVNGVAILVGGTGMGKSLVARSAASKLGGFTIVDLRATETNESLNRLDLFVGRVGALSAPAIVLEDCDNYDAPGALIALGRVLKALQRRDRICILTSHRRPPPRALAELGLDETAVVDAPYFTEDEARAVVKTVGGDPDAWGRLTYLASASGHPQLAHAFAMGMAARGWPQGAMVEVVIGGFTSDDIDAERIAVRRSLATVLSGDALNLLYRLSLTIGHFDRALALEIGAMAPAIPQAGALLDEMVGPWIEALGEGQYRLSPLAGRAGQEMLTANVQLQVHKFIAVRLLARRRIDASDANMILAHALVGKSSGSLVALSLAVITTDRKDSKLLSEHFFLLRILRTDAPIYPSETLVSAMLRLAQFKLVAETGNSADIRACVTALFREIGLKEEEEARTGFEALALGTVLMTIGIADYIPNWLDLLVRFVNMVETEAFLKEINANFEQSSASAGVSTFGMLFSIGAFRIASVRRLEEVVDALDAVDARVRTLLLDAYEKKPNDYSNLVNGPWGAEHARGVLDWMDVAQRYQRMADRTRAWGARALALRCSVARSIMFDEYGNDKQAGLRVLDDAAVALGNGSDIVLARARAKIFWRDDDHASALAIFKNIAENIGRDDPVERAFAMREAAICAAKTGDWALAETWFAEGHSAAAAAHTDHMHAMAIGLCADAAVAAYQSEQIGRALTKMAEALRSLKALNPDVTLMAAYCHRVVRHTVLWLKSQLEGGETLIDGQPIAMLPGTCSNPEPVDTIRQLPLGHIDIALYMLAEAEVLSGSDVGIAASLSDNLVQGPILVCDYQLQQTWIASAIVHLDPASFAQHFLRWLEVTRFIHENSVAMRAEFSVIDPPRSEVPRSEDDPRVDPHVAAMAIDGVLAFCMVAVLTNRGDVIVALEARLRAECGEEFPGAALFNYWNGEANSLAEAETICAEGIRTLRGGEHVEPKPLWGVALRFFEKCRVSPFKRYVMEFISTWLRGQWRRIIGNEAFRLVRPRVTVADIQKVLDNPTNDESFTAALLLTSSNAVGADLAPELQNLLRTAARGVSTANYSGTNREGEVS